MRKVILGAIGALLLVACGDDDDGGSPDAPITPTFDARTFDAPLRDAASADATPPDAASPDAIVQKPCTTTLQPAANATEAVQNAFIAAANGDVICFADGTYGFDDELSLTKDGITLRGNTANRTAVVLNFSAQTGGGSGIHGQGTDDFVIEGMVIRDSAGDGVRIDRGTNLTFRNITVEWSTPGDMTNGAYGVYPVESENILIDNVEVRHASDAGIYVGQSKKALVRNSRAQANVAGIEIENTDDAEVRDNIVTGNVTGILIFNLPQLAKKTGARTKVHGNTVEMNNIASFAPGGIVSFLPPGAGMLILAYDDAEVHGNTIRSNTSSAIVVVSCPTVALIAALGGGTVNCSDTGYDTFAEKVNIHDNTITGNAADPAGAYELLLPPGGGTGPLYDIIWDGLVDSAKPAEANKLCIRNNGAATFARINIADDFSRTTSLEPHDCTHPSLPGIEVTW